MTLSLRSILALLRDTWHRHDPVRRMYAQAGVAYTDAQKAAEDQALTRANEGRDVSCRVEDAANQRWHDALMADLLAWEKEFQERKRGSDA